MPSLVILAASFLRYRAEKQTHRQPEVKTLPPPPRLPSAWVIIAWNAKQVLHSKYWSHTAQIVKTKYAAHDDSH